MACSRWAIEIKRSSAPRLSKGFHQARVDLEPEHCFVVYPGRERYPLAAGVDAIGVSQLADVLRKP